MVCKQDDLSSKLVECLNEKDNLTNDLDQWIRSLKELSDMKKAFPIKEEKLHRKTILDIGSYCVKPLYLALKFQPEKIIGINELPYSYSSEIEQNSRLLTKTQIRFYDCSFFDDENFQKILEEENIEKFDIILISKTLHHLRTGKCSKKHKHRKDEKCCKYDFMVEDIFDRLLQLGNRVIVYENFFPQDEDEDKIRGRGGYFTREEWHSIFAYLVKRYRVQFIRPIKCQLNERKLKNVIDKLKQVDYVCFYVVV